MSFQSPYLMCSMHACWSMFMWIKESLNEIMSLQRTWIKRLDSYAFLSRSLFEAPKFWCFKGRTEIYSKYLVFQSISGWTVLLNEYQQWLKVQPGDFGTIYSLHWLMIKHFNPTTHWLQTAAKKSYSTDDWFLSQICLTLEVEQLNPTEIYHSWIYQWSCLCYLVLLRYGRMYLSLS